MFQLDVDHLCNVGWHKVVSQSLSQLILVSTHWVKLADKDISNWCEHICESVRGWSGWPVRSDYQTVFLLAIMLLWRDHVLIASRLEFLLRLM